MFAKLGALALFASLAAAFQVSVAPQYTFVGGRIQVLVSGAVPSDYGKYNFVLDGPVENYRNPLSYDLSLSSDAAVFPFTIPEGTPAGYDYYVDVVRSDDPAVRYQSQNFVIE